MAQIDFPLADARHPFHLLHMEMALEEAGAAAGEDEVPIGAVIVHPEKGVIARAHNQREMLRDPTAHAEMIALTQAARALDSWRLDDAIVYVTLEPCPMCAGAMVQARSDGGLRQPQTRKPASLSYALPDHQRPAP